MRDPRALRCFHAVATITWICLIPPTLLWWSDSILWVALMSIWANIASHWAAYQATRVEEKQENS